MIESHASYVLGILEKAIAACGPAFEIEIKRDVFDLYNERVQEAHNRMIWTHEGMSNWYRNAKGRVVVYDAISKRCQLARRTQSRPE